MTHRVELSNGEVLLVIEGSNQVDLATEEEDAPGEPDKYIASITTDGVLTYTSCFDAPERLVDDLNPQDQKVESADDLDPLKPQNA